MPAIATMLLAGAMYCWLSTTIPPRLSFSPVSGAHGPVRAGAGALPDAVCGARYGFIAGVVVLYLVSLKLIYLPVVRLFREASAVRFLVRDQSGNTTPLTYRCISSPLLPDFRPVVGVAGDLWFLAAAAITRAVAALVLLTFRGDRGVALEAARREQRGRIRFVMGREAFNRVASSGHVSRSPASPTLSRSEES